MRSRRFPSAIGLESAGVIDAVGPDVHGLKVGDRVAYAGAPDGSYAEVRIVPAARVIPLPDGIDERTAASMMIRGMTARMLLRETYRVKAGDTILIHAAAGGVGLIVCQWAKHLGATVIGTVGSDEKAEVARAHGCDHPIVYTREDFAERVREITGGEGLPVVYDSVGRATFEGSLKCLRPARHHGLVRRSLGRSRSDAAAAARPSRLDLSHPSERVELHVTRDELLTSANELFAMVLSGKIKIEISRSYPLRDAPRAHADIEARKTTGSIVLVV